MNAALAPATERPRQAKTEVLWSTVPDEADDEQPQGSKRGMRNPWRLAGIALAGLAVLMVATFVMVYDLGSMIHDRDQRKLLAQEKATINNAASANQGLYRPVLPTLPPAPGTPVGLLVVPVLGLQQVVVEGTGPSQTIAGIGHEPGTAGLGQPGNAAIVGRSSGYGAPFGNLKELRTGDRLVVATTEGESVYVVHSVRVRTLVTPGTAALAATHASTSTPSAGSATSPTASKIGPAAPISSATKRPQTVSTATVFASGTTNKLTLLTSASAAPWNSSKAVIVVARMLGQPFQATPQESRTISLQGNGGDTGALPWLMISLLILGVVVVGSREFYRRLSLRAAWLLTTAPLIVATLFVALAGSRLIPAWL